MILEYEVFDRKVAKAKEKLMGKWLAVDGSGDEDIEGVFTLLSLTRCNRLILFGSKRQREEEREYDLNRI